MMLIRVYYSTEHGGLSRMGEKAAGQFRGSCPFFVSCASTKKSPGGGGGRSPPHRIPLPLGGGQGDSSGGVTPFLRFMRKHQKITWRGRGRSPRIESPSLWEGVRGTVQGKLPHFYISCASTGKSPAATACTFQGSKGCFHWRGRGRSPPHRFPSLWEGVRGTVQGKLSHFYVSCASTKKSPAATA